MKSSDVGALTVERRGGVDLTLAGDGSQQLSLVIGKQIVVGLVVNFLFMQNLVGRSEYIFLVKLTLWGAVETVEDFLHIPRLTVNHIIQVDEGFLRHFSLLLRTEKMICTLGTNCMIERMNASAPISA